MANNDDLKLVLSFEQTVYAIGQPVQAVLTFRNSSDPLLVNTRFLVNFSGSPGEITFEISKDGGDLLVFQELLVPRPLDDTDFVQVTPEEPVMAIVDLSDKYGLREGGEYAIQAFYFNDSEPEAKKGKVWKGEISSNAVKLKVEP